MAKGEPGQDAMSPLQLTCNDKQRYTGAFLKGKATATCLVMQKTHYEESIACLSVNAQQPVCSITYE